MRLFFFLLVVLATSTFGQTKNESDIKAIKAYVIKMNKRLMELEAKVKELEKENKALRGNNQNISANDDAVSYGFGRNANKEALRAITVPSSLSGLIFERAYFKIYIKL